MGEVFLARDQQLQRQVAIKFLLNQEQAVPDPEQLYREARMLAQLSHQNIVQVYDLVQLQGRPALVMEYVQGRSLHHILRERSADKAERLRWLYEVAVGLAVAHEAGIVHNDLKPENVLIGPDNTAKISDFGIARAGRDKNGDLRALGELIIRLLAGHEPLSPALEALVDGLGKGFAINRISASEAASVLKGEWIEFAQDLTPIPTSSPSAVSRPKPVLSAIAVLLAGMALLTLWMLYEPAPQPATLVYVAPTRLDAGSEDAGQRTVLLRRAVNEALRQNVIASPSLVLHSSYSGPPKATTPQEMRAELGVDEILASKLECDSQGVCTLQLERLGGDPLVVMQAAQTTILPDQLLEARAIIHRQWSGIYKTTASDTAATARISEQAYTQYLALYSQAYAIDHFDPDMLRDIENLLQQETRFLPLYLLYAHAALNAYDVSGDTTYLQKLEMTLSRADLWAGRSRELRHAWIQYALEAWDLELAASELEVLATLGEDEAVLRQLQGDILRYQGDYERARGQYEQALKLRPSRSLYDKLADNYRLAGNLEDALATYRLSFEKYGSNKEDVALLGVILMELGRLDEAIAVLEEAASNNPDSMSMSDLGLAYLLQGRYTEARSTFLAARDAGSREPTLLLNLADTEQLLGNQAVAQSIYQGLIAQWEDDPDTVHTWIVSQSYAQLGRHKQAINMLRAVTNATAETAFNAALVYVLAGESISAVVEIERALTDGFGAIWFTLPWFSPLCIELEFVAMMADSGFDNFCRGPATIAS